MKTFNTYKLEEAKKSKVKINPKLDDIKERADTWHPDPEQDRKLGGPGANQRAREDAAASAKPKEDPKKLRPGESYMDWNKRQQANRTRTESAVPGKPAERLGAVTAIPQSERDAAKARLLAKTKAIRDKKLKEETGASKKNETKFHLKLDKLVHKTFGPSPEEKKINKEEFEVCPTCGCEPCECESIEEGMDMKAFKDNRRKLKRREASADAKKRGHVGKEWYNSGRTYSPDEAKSGRAKLDDAERQSRHRSAIDPEGDDDLYSADRTKNPKKRRKQDAMGESLLSFSNFMEARRMDKEGVDRGDDRRADRAEKAKASVAAVKKRQAVLDKHEKKTGTKLDISKSVEGKAHARNHPGSRQAPKERGAKETPQETQNRRVNASNKRRMTHGWTSKEKAANRGMENAGSRFD